MVYLVLSTEINKSEDQEHELFPITESFFSLLSHPAVNPRRVSLYPLPRNA
jgi:hypothetical protein